MSIDDHRCGNNLNKSRAIRRGSVRKTPCRRNKFEGLQNTTPFFGAPSAVMAFNYNSKVALVLLSSRADRRTNLCAVELP
jgi:hypothetical protein